MRTAADTLANATDKELMDAGVIGPGLESVSVQGLMSYSGALPMPEQFNAYDAETRERICRWNDASTVDESRRQDLLVENEIRQQERGALLAAVLMALFAVLSFIAFLVTRDPASFSLLSVPCLTVVGNVLKPVFSKSSRNK